MIKRANDMKKAYMYTEQEERVENHSKCANANAMAVM